MVADRLDRLPRPALEALQWAATLGSHFAVDALGELTAQHPEELLRYLDLLERHAFLRASAGASGGYVFRTSSWRRRFTSGSRSPGAS